MGESGLFLLMCSFLLTFLVAPPGFEHFNPKILILVNYCHFNMVRIDTIYCNQIVKLLLWLFRNNQWKFGKVKTHWSRKPICKTIGSSIHFFSFHIQRIIINIIFQSHSRWLYSYVVPSPRAVSSHGILLIDRPSTTTNYLQFSLYTHARILYV